MLAAAGPPLGCSEGDEQERPPDRDGPLVVYSSTPNRGPHAAAGRAFVAGARLALAHAEGRADGFGVRYVPLDSADPEAGATPEIANANAERAAGDPAAIAYLGELDPATAAVSLPILNEAGIAQVGAASLPAGLTRALASAGAGEPERHYPTGTRHFVRIVPSEERVTATLAGLMEARGCERAFALTRTGGASRGRLRQMALALESAGVAVGGEAEIGAALDRSGAAAIAADIDLSGSGCLAVLRISAAQLEMVVRASESRLPSFGDEWLADPAARGRGAAGASRAVAVTGAPEPPPNALDDPWSLYGYEAMALVLDALERAEPSADRRAALIRALFATRERRSVLGTYSINRYGDTTGGDLGLWRAGARHPGYLRRVESASPTS